MRPNSVTVRNDLTAYAYGLAQDMNKVAEIAKLIAPVVPTGGMSGLYNLFSDQQAFKKYSEGFARRAVGGQANVIGFLSTTANYNCEEYGLRISVDQTELARAGFPSNPNAKQLVEQAKTRTLTANCMLSYLGAVITTVKASVAAASGSGVWLSPNVDPISEINAQMKAMWLATGMVPSDVLIDFGAWICLADNTNVQKRMPGADIITMTPERVGKMLINPNAKITIVDTAALASTGGLGLSSSTLQGVLGGSVLMFYNSPFPTVYDPSFAKTFSPSASLFTEVYSYEEAPHLTWYENDWCCQPVVVASGLCRRIDVTGATA